MPAYLCISIGATPETAAPLVASNDPDIVADAIRSILGKVVGEATPDRASARRRRGAAPISPLLGTGGH